MSFHFEATLASRDFEVSLHCEPGETLAVLGPNGAGKSTLLAIIAGLLRPDSGRASMGERELFDLGAHTRTWHAPHLRGTALLAQEPLLFPHLSALENVAFGQRSQGFARQPHAAVPVTGLPPRRPKNLLPGAPTSCPAGRRSVLPWPARWPPRPNFYC